MNKKRIKEELTVSEISSNSLVVPDCRRLEIALEYIKGKSSYRVLGEKYGLSANTIRRSVLTFVEENPMKAELMKKEKDNTPEDELSRLRGEVKELKARLEYEHLRAVAYDTMIDIAEEKFNIAIRKKADTKR